MDPCACSCHAVIFCGVQQTRNLAPVSHISQNVSAEQITTNVWQDIMDLLLRLADKVIFVFGEGSKGNLLSTSPIKDPIHYSLLINFVS